MAGSGIAYLVAVAWPGFHVGLNDFWGNVALARFADWSSPASFYNQFFPVGYTLILKLFGSRPVVPAILLSVAAAVWLLVIAGRLAARLFGDWWAVAVVIGLACHPQVFRYATTPGPDILTAAFLAAGFERLGRAESDRRSAWMAGALFGIAALFRYHALMFAAAVIAAHVITRWRHLRGADRSDSRNVPLDLWTFGTLLGVMAVVYSPQMLVSVLAGYSPLHTGQAWIFYKLMHPLNWTDVGQLPAPVSAFGVVMAEPKAFAVAYGRALVSLVWLPWSAAVLGVLSLEERHRRFGQVSFFTIVLYLLAVASGGSSRGTLPAIFLVVIPAVGVAALAFAYLRSRISPRAAVGIMAVAGMIFLGGDLRDDYGLVKYRAIDHRTFASVQSLVQRDGVTESSQVFSSNFDLYFPSLAGYVPRTNGTWLRLAPAAAGLPPELCLTSVECFLRDAVQSGVTHVVFDAQAMNATPVLGYIAAVLEPRGSAGGFVVFRVR